MQPHAIMKTAEKADNAAEALSAKINLVGLTREEMREAMEPLKVEPFRVKQIWDWMYKKGVTDFAQMSNIAGPTRAKLAEHFLVARAGIAQDKISLDATRKWLLRYADDNEVETVFIPDPPRGTLCVSSQVGCTLACTFCHTGTQRLVRNLTAAEIITQVLVARDGLGEWSRARDDRMTRLSDDPYKAASTNKNKQRHGSSDHPIIGSSPSGERQLTNIVFMGMGEPLFNYDHVVKACKILMDAEGLAISKRKITVSTSGVVPRIYSLADDANVNLAISLHAVTDALRDEIVPINRKYPIKELLESCRYYASKSQTRRIMFEYVMLAGVNDSEAEARELVRLLKHIPSKVNLIPFNPWPGAPYQCSSNNRIHAFGRILMEAGLAAPIRRSRGQDILAACGQLKSLSELKKGQKVKL
ncbi:MAG: 23S rRNA (adenine(2503)-C(2))-methyltransferase RlmN [Alphaproteobacteria bacterium]|nr:23S rRNA (adenine(2503)-C(2))-methyltransferase RlmN [Rickettsiales bacterium]